jgi:hypothetical protein
MDEQSPLSADEQSLICQSDHLPATEDAAILEFCGRSIPLTLRVYGEIVPLFVGDRETPNEPSAFCVDKVTLGAAGIEADITSLLDDDDIREIEDHVAEAIGIGP